MGAATLLARSHELVLPCLFDALGRLEVDRSAPGGDSQTLFGLLHVARHIGAGIDGLAVSVRTAADTVA